LYAGARCYRQLPMACGSELSGEGADNLCLVPPLLAPAAAVGWANWNWTDEPSKAAESAISTTNPSCSTGNTKGSPSRSPLARSAGGFVDAAPKFPLDYFQFETIEGDVDMNPSDAKGMVLGMSMPIPWKRAT
jgi:hypothetical protein